MKISKLYFDCYSHASGYATNAVNLWGGGWHVSKDESGWYVEMIWI